MNFKEKFSENPTVDISVVKLKNRKVTRSIFNQIETTKSYLPNSEFFNDVKILGMISDKQFPWMIIEKDGRLLKSPLELLLKLLRSKSIKDAFDFLDVDYDLIKDLDMDDSYGLLPAENVREFESMKNEANLHLTILKSHQIYL